MYAQKIVQNADKSMFSAECNLHVTLKPVKAVYQNTKIISQIIPNRCTILLNIFISLLYMFRAFMCQSSGENYCIYATLVFVTL